MSNPKQVTKETVKNVGFGLMRENHVPVLVVKDFYLVFAEVS